MVVSLLSLAITTYRIADLGAPPGAESVKATMINNRGEVLLKAEGRGYLWRAGRFLDLGKPIDSRTETGPGRVEPTALNDFGIAVGGEGGFGPIFMTGLEDAEAFLWRGKCLERPGTRGPSEAHGINNLGDVVGGVYHRAFARLRGTLVLLPNASHIEPHDPNGEMNDLNEATAIAINDRRRILMNANYGLLHKNSGLSERPFLVDGNAPLVAPRPLPLPKGFDGGRGLALNRRGTVLAVANRYDAGGGRVYLVRKGRVVLLPFDADLGFTGALNGRDEVVGSSPPRLWRAGKVTNLPTFSGWTLQTATGINDRGQICGTGEHDGKRRAYVLTPV